MRLLLFANQASGSGTNVEDLRTRLRAAGATLVDAPADAERSAVSSGDGMIGEAAAFAAAHRLPLAVIPSGTANDFARANRIPRDLDAAVRLAVTGTRLTEHELGRVDGQPFVNTTAVGLSPAAGRRAEPLKQRLGPLAYPVGALLAGLRDPSLECQIDEHFTGRAWQVIVACTGAFGGGAEIEAADQHDGRLDLFVLPDRGRRHLPRYARAMRGGHLAELPEVLHVRDDAFTVQVAAGTAVNVDGELAPDRDGTLNMTVDDQPFELVSP